jgi:hypothetical protein
MGLKFILLSCFKRLISPTIDKMKLIKRVRNKSLCI